MIYPPPQMPGSYDKYPPPNIKYGSEYIYIYIYWGGNIKEKRLTIFEPLPRGVLKPQAGSPHDEPVPFLLNQSGTTAPVLYPGDKCYVVCLQRCNNNAFVLAPSLLFRLLLCCDAQNPAGCALVNHHSTPCSEPIHIPEHCLEMSPVHFCGRLLPP